MKNKLSIKMLSIVCVLGLVFGTIFGESELVANAQVDINDAGLINDSCGSRERRLDADDCVSCPKDPRCTGNPTGIADPKGADEPRGADEPKGSGDSMRF